MIHREELRYGNWVLGVINPTTPVQIKSIDSTICKAGEYLDDYASLKPIELTRNIMLRLGFKNPNGEEETEDIFAIRIGGVYIQWYLRTGHMNIGSMECKPIKYLHQLQNRIFSLTETELNFKP